MFFLPARLFASTFYVDSGTGSDSNDGSLPIMPWQSLIKVNSGSFTAGDTILFRSGAEWTGILHLTGQGGPSRPIVIDKYGGDKLPLIRGDGKEHPYVVFLDNVRYMEVNNLEITDAGKDSSAVRSGVYIYNNNSGTNHHIWLKKLFIHDITGFCNHDKGFGDAINWYCRANGTNTNFDDLLIEDCRMEKIARNGVWGWTDHWQRDKWFPSRNVIIRLNVLKDLGMSGIVVIGCDGALAEHNFVEKPSLGGDGGIGIWTWSSDNCLVQFNEVTGARGTHDAQAFDSDWNCHNNIYQYNYSHDNAGGFMLVCTPETNPSNLGCVGTVIRYNLSVNDGAITNTFAIWGPCEDTWVYNNTIFSDSSFHIPLTFYGQWDRWASGTHFLNNIFHTGGSYSFAFGSSSDNTFSHNLWSGKYTDPPADACGIYQDPAFRGPGFTKPSDFMLRDASPAIGRGLAVQNDGDMDCRGNKVPDASSPTIGAFEVEPDQSSLASEDTHCLNLFDFIGNSKGISTSGLGAVPVNKHLLKIIRRKTGSGYLTLTAPEGNWNLYDYTAISMNISNLGTDPVRVSAWTGTEEWVDGSVFVLPGESENLQILFKRKTGEKDAYLLKYFDGMNGLPGGCVRLWVPMDFSDIRSITVKVSENPGGCTLLLSDLVATGLYAPPPEELLKTSFFPFIDPYGQYVHLDWPGKTLDTSDLVRAVEEEREDLEKFPGPSEWDEFGGWLNGPQMDATGSFRVEKTDGRWWFIDPKGYLFWSHGITCVRFNNGTTRISGRSHYFETLPGGGSPLYRFYDFRGKDTAFTFSEANLYRKYGPAWNSLSANLAHQRLRSWGMNTMANWSDPEIYLQHNTPYTVDIDFDWPALGGGTKKFPDVFDPRFRVGLKEKLAREKELTADDTWCIGYFIDNELRWDDLSLTVLSSPQPLPAKKALVEYLNEKYKLIKDLNKRWGTKFASWDKLMNTPVTGVSESARNDLREFDKIIADLYYKICNEELKAVAPDKLYLGSRLDFHYYPDDKEYEWVIYAAAKYCDVISFNRYRFSAADLVLPVDIDKPVIIGEFHFGALDRGLLHTGLRSVKDQEQRGEAYLSYVEGALRNPCIVGVHWFQYGDQPCTGRFDGENYQVGFLDICDNPYRETIAASRQIGYRLYSTRYRSQPAAATK